MHLRTFPEGSVVTLCKQKPSHVQGTRSCACFCAATDDQCCPPWDDLDTCAGCQPPPCHAVTRVQTPTRASSEHQRAPGVNPLTSGAPAEMDDDDNCLETRLQTARQPDDGSQQTWPRWSPMLAPLLGPWGERVSVSFNVENAGDYRGN